MYKKPLTVLFLLANLGIVIAACTGSSDRQQKGESLQQFSMSAETPVQLTGRREVLGDGSVRFGAAGFAFSVKFEGSRIEAELEDEFRDNNNYNWFTVFIDGQEVNRFRTERGKTHYILAEELADTVHTARIIKDSEGQNGWITLKTIYAEQLLEPPELPERKIEFIGNSITAGAAMDESLHPCGSTDRWFDQHRASHSYGVLLADYFEAQWMLTAVGGMGMYRNWNSPSPVMPDRYDGVYADFKAGQPEWDHSRYRPDLIVIGLGTNDFSSGGGSAERLPFDAEQFYESYAGFVERLRRIHPQAKLLLLTSPMLDEEREQQHFELLNQIPDARVYRFRERYTSGCDEHPDVEEHRKMAEELKPVIKAYMGW